MAEISRPMKRSATESPSPAPEAWVARTVRLVALALAATLVALLQAFAPGVLGGVERVAGDLNWRLLADDHAQERRVVIIDIDERSLRDLGPWPWPRTTLAQLSERLAQAGVATQVYDIVFPESRPGDDALAQAWRAAPVTAGQILSIDPQVEPRIGRVAGATGQACPPFAPLSRGYIANAADLAAATSSVGHLTPRLESDGVVRGLPALVCHEGRAYPTLALAALGRLAGEGEGQSWRVEAATAGGPTTPPAWAAPHARLVHPALPGLSVPVDAQGNVRVPYRHGRMTFASISASDLLAGRADLRVLSGAVALVGSTSFGLGDAIATPLSATASGLEVHVQLLAGLLDQRVPVTPAAAGAWQWGAGLLLLGLLYLLASHTPAPSSRLAAVRLPLAGAVLAAAVYAGALGGLAVADLWLPWAVPASLALLGALMLATAEHGLTRAQRERLFAHLGAYLPGTMARRLALTRPSGRVMFDRRDVTVMVADIRNFSAFAAHRPPEDTAELLHAFFSTAVEVIEAHGGVVENVVGDSVMAVWNAYGEPSPAPVGGRHPALAAARELLQRTRVLLEPRHAVHDADPIQPLALGIGLESGSAVVGSFGPQRRRMHAALGEPVSVATRLQAMTQELSYPILVGPVLAASTVPEDTEPLGQYLLEGLPRHYAVHAATGWESLLGNGIQWVAVTPGQDVEAVASQALLGRPQTSA